MRPHAMSQEDTRSVIEELSSALPTPRHESRPGTEDWIGLSSLERDHSPPVDEEEEKEDRFSRSANPDPVDSHTSGQASGSDPNVNPQRSQPDPVASVAETAVMLSDFIRQDMLALRNKPEGSAAPRIKELCEVLRTLQRPPISCPSPSRRQLRADPGAIPHVPANRWLTHQEIRCSTKLKGKQGEDAGATFRDIHAKASDKAKRFGGTPQRIDHVPLQDVETIALGDALLILAQLRSGQIDWEQKDRGSSTNLQLLDPLTTWADFSQACIAHAMPANIIELLQVQLHEFAQGDQES